MVTMESNFEANIANLVTSTALSLYAAFPSNSKPASPDVFTVYSAIVAVVEKGESTKPFVKVVSCATGTKCVGADQFDITGKILHDSHAEVLARRGFIRFITLWILRLIHHPPTENTALCPIKRTETCTPCQSKISFPFQLKDNWKFYLYISDSPCGDATIYPNILGQDTFTGAKLIRSSDIVLSVSVDDTGHCLRECGEQSIGSLRTKSGRSDIQHRSNSMSCSDKICRWILLGLQGGILYQWIGNLPLSGIYIGLDPAASTPEAQYTALQRALLHRWKSSSWTQPDHSMPELQIIRHPDLQFQHSKSIIKYTKLQEDQKQNNVVTENIIQDAELNSFLMNEECHEPITKKARNEKKTKNKNECSSQQEKRGNTTITSIPFGNSLNWQLHIPIIPNSELIQQQQPARDSTSSEVTTSLRLVNDQNTFQENKKWIKCLGGSMEMTIAHTGLPQGMNHKTLATAATSITSEKEEIVRISQYKLSSRLSRYQMYDLFRWIEHNLPSSLVVSTSSSRKADGLVANANKDSVDNTTVDCPTQCLSEEMSKHSSVVITDDVTSVVEKEYRAWKEAQMSEEYLELSEKFFSHELFQYWIRSSSKLQPDDLN